MEQKVQAIFDELGEIFQNGRIEYRFVNELHKFRLERSGPSVWLYISRNFVDDHTRLELIESISRWQLQKIFVESSQNKWLFLSEHGVREVDSSFGR